MNSFDDHYRIHRGQPGWWQTCEAIGVHQGDSCTQDDEQGRWDAWTCCDEREFIGELIDCDTCLEPSILRPWEDLPAGWVEDTNGSHCPRCQPCV